MTTTLVTWGLILKVKLYASLLTLTLPGTFPLAGPDIDYNDNKVSPEIRAMRSAILSNFLYVLAGLCFLLVVWGIAQKATGNKSGVAKIGWGLAGTVVCLFPTEAGQWLTNVFRDLTGI